jgi:hypothetical protein
MLDRIHNGLAGYLSRQGLRQQAERVDGAVVLIFDKRYRVYCRPALHGDLVLECRIVDLPVDEREADDMIRECLYASWVRMQEYPDIPALSDDGLAIVVQLPVPSDSTINEFEAALEAYVNSLADWRRIFRIV